MLTILNIARQEEKLFSQEIIRSIKPQLDALIDAAEQEDAEEHKFEGEVQKEIQGSKIQPNTKQPGRPPRAATTSTRSNHTNAHTDAHISAHTNARISAHTNAHTSAHINRHTGPAGR